MTHAEIVLRAARWLRCRSGKRPACKVVFAEIVTAIPETPDAIGWTSTGQSHLVECKTSRADFRRDAEKSHVRHDMGMGRLRYYMAPAGVLVPAELPAGWGLLVVQPSGAVRVEVEPTARELSLYAQHAEAAVLVSAIRRHELGAEWFPDRSRFEPYARARVRVAATRRGAA